jgi:uncharacterized paraquat-inducible protein A
MPWCDTCDRIVENEELHEGGCPRCGAILEAPERGPLPWRFRLMIGAAVIYLVWRVVQMIGWLVH